MLKDIVERDTATTPATPPSAPSSSSGFPTIVHRSQRTKLPSKFAHRATAGSGIIIGKLAHELPKVHSSVPEPASGEQAQQDEHMDDAAKILREVDEENRRKVENMSAEEREREVEEIKQRFGGGIVDIMRRRREKREAQGMGTDLVDNGAASASRESGLSETEQIYADVDEENTARVAGMSMEERAQEVVELEERFGGSIMEALRRRAEARAKQKGKGRVAESINEDTAQEAFSTPYSSDTRKVRFDPESISSASQDDVARYFPGQEPETDKLEWTQPLSSSSSKSSSIRFDLSGNLLSAEQQLSLPVNLGLHHHGDQPDMAGYTIEEMLLLSRSTVPSQRVRMMGVLARVIERYLGTQEDSKVKAELVKLETTTKATALAVDVLLRVRGVNLIQTAIELLYISLGGQTWGWMDENESLSTASFKPLSQPLFVSIDTLPFEDLLPRLADMFESRDYLPAITTHQLARIIRRAATHSINLAETVLALAPVILKAHTTSLTWPPTEPFPLVEPVRLVGDLVAASRICAAELHKARVIDSLLRYLLVNTWESNLDLSLELATEVLYILRSLARYGIGSSLATSAAEMWRDLDMWIRQHVSSTGPGKIQRMGVAVAYYDLLAVWYTCAVDPHRTTPEHDLTWARAEPLGWKDGAVDMTLQLSVLENIKGGDPSRVRVMVASLGVVVSWLEGVQVNGVRHGEEEKQALVDKLKPADLSALASALLEDELSDTTEGLILRILQLHSHLPGLGAVPLIDPSVFTKPETARTSFVRTAIRHELLHGRHDTTDIPARILDILSSYLQGSEPLALASLDLLLSLPSTDLMPDVQTAINGIGHQDGLVILRPLLQHAILPDQAHITAPTQPSHVYLKATTSLRAQANDTASDDEKAPRRLPLPRDWLFHPLNELLRSADSIALQQAPPDWQPTETQLVRAMLSLVLLSETTTRNMSFSMSRADILWGVMRVYMLEHQPGSGPDNEGEVFRDEVIAPILKTLIDGTSSFSGSDIAPTGKDTTTATFIDTPTPTPTPAPAPLEVAAAPFLGIEPLFNLYQDLVSLFENVSYGDQTFARILLPPISMRYPPDYRKHLWSTPTVLRLIRTRIDQVPIDHTDHSSRPVALEPFFHPAEQDPELLSLYGQALVRGWVSPASPFLWKVAIHHLAVFAFSPIEIELGMESGKIPTPGEEVQSEAKVGAAKTRMASSSETDTATDTAAGAATATPAETRKALDKLRKGLMTAVFNSAPVEVLRALLVADINAPLDNNGEIGVDGRNEERVERERIVLNICGDYDKIKQRLAAVAG